MFTAPPVLFAQLGMTGRVLDTCERDADEWGCCMQVETEATISVQLDPAVEGYFTEDVSAP